jgi:SAM-dependent methyltransferase
MPLSSNSKGPVKLAFRLEKNFMERLMRPLIYLANQLLRMFMKREFRKQTYITFNERPVEYQFAFKQIAKYCPIQVLDIGTGKSAFPSLVRQCGLVVTAIDNIRDFWPKGMCNRHYYILNDDIRATKLNIQFDMITCISVLEHIRDADAAVRSMFKLLKAGGHLVLTFPYNEQRYIENVYDLAGSNAPPGLPYVTQAFSRRQVQHWLVEHQAQLVAQEYWRYYSGPYWSVGERLSPPVQVNGSELHQLTLLLLHKPLSATRA